ncbi:MAG TPA: hypothetical protein V6D19_13215 [Stenomitos sp.]
MKKLTPVLGIGFIYASSMVMPFSALAMPRLQDGPDLSETPSRSAPQFSRKMAAYRDCVQAHADLKDIDFKKVSKFCSCVSDQSLQADSSGFSNCATGGDGGNTLGMIGEIAPSVLMGVVQELTTRSSNSSSSSRDNGLLGKGGGLLDGLGGVLGSNGGGFNLKDLKDIFKKGF